MLTLVVRSRGRGTDVRAPRDPHTQSAVWGHGTIVQADNDADIIQVRNVPGVDIIWNMGYGLEYWHSGTAAGDNMVAMKLESGAFRGAPPMANVVIRNNVVATRSFWTLRYGWALWVDEDLSLHEVRVGGNAFHAGSKGVTNIKQAP